MQAFESDFSYKDIKDSIQSFKRKKNAINFKKIILLGILSLITIILGTSVLMTKWNIKQLKVQFSSLKEKNDEVVLKKTTIEKEIELLQKENNELKDKITFGENFSKGLKQEIEKTEKDTKSLLNKIRRL